MNKLIDVIVGARPNFIKVAAILKELDICIAANMGFSYRLIHTSQHYDNNMSSVFFEELNMPTPDINLNVGSVENSKQIATIIARYSKVLEENKPDMVIVSGDVNSTVACAIATKKVDPNIPLAHVEGGLRCGDKQMPEEINRILTDSITDYFFTTSAKASENLINESVNPNNIHFVGNTMIDTLYNNAHRFKKPAFWVELSMQSKAYFVLTIHRQSNISDAETISNILNTVSEAAGSTLVIFPSHPHTAKMISDFKITIPENVYMTEPLGYLEFNYLVKNAKAVVTDSGGISEETTIMNVPCMTLRDNTERPETCILGTNMLLGNSSENILSAFQLLNEGHWQLGRNPELWDGKSAERIVNIIIDILKSSKDKKNISIKSRNKIFGDLNYNTIHLS